MQKKPGILASFVLIGLLGLAPALAGDESGMASKIESWEKQYNAGDFAALARHYADDATRMPYQAPVVQGRAAIAEMNKAFHESGAVKIKLELLGSESEGGMAWAHGRYHLMAADGSSLQTGKWMNVSRKIDGKWFIQADIWNTDAP